MWLSLAGCALAGLASAPNGNRGEPGGYCAKNSMAKTAGYRFETATIIMLEKFQSAVFAGPLSWCSMGQSPESPDSCRC